MGPFLRHSVVPIPHKISDYTHSCRDERLTAFNAERVLVINVVFRLPLDTKMSSHLHWGAIRHDSWYQIKWHHIAYAKTISLISTCRSILLNYVSYTVFLQQTIIASQLWCGLCSKMSNDVLCYICKYFCKQWFTMWKKVLFVISHLFSVLWLMSLERT